MLPKPSRGRNFRDTLHISLIKSYGFYFRVGEIFVKKAISRKTQKLPPCENFHVYSFNNISYILQLEASFESKWLSAKNEEELGTPCTYIYFDIDL